MLSLCTNGYRRTRISGVFYFSPHLAAASLPAGTRSRFKNTRANCASACISTARPYSKCFKASAQPSSTPGRTDTATLNAVAVHKWLQANQNLWSVLLFTASGSANNTVKTFEEKRPKDGAGHGQLACKALTEKYNGHTKEARRACHEKLNTKMEPGQDPDIFFVLDERCDFLEEVGQRVHDRRHEEIIPQALPPDYERVRNASYKRWDFGLDDIRHIVEPMYVDNLSRSVNAKPVAGRSIVMQVVGHTSSDVRCNCCKGIGHVTQNCTILKEQRGPNPGVSNISENSTCLATVNQDQETRGEGQIKIGGALSVRVLRIAMRTVAPSMVSAVQTPVTPTVPLTTSTTRSRSPQWNQSTPTGYSNLSVASAEKRVMTRSSWSRKNRPSNRYSESRSSGV